MQIYLLLTMAVMALCLTRSGVRRLKLDNMTPKEMTFFLMLVAVVWAPVLAFLTGLLLFFSVGVLYAAVCRMARENN